ncbi:sphingomyelin synthase 2 [Plasmodium gonderi]|uniref:Sphingomyelin synthase 2 n=1 Tax=Plasmodium gonderi TaxID=77519 RepID=A0A1Y1JHR7_PLAGO|nr:sphingomyelin synthase 2 [Plasmodium gonderi]GAW81780.1 sphingomyelin synthase 2 [Plasmodium gonderi]
MSITTEFKKKTSEHSGTENEDSNNCRDVGNYKINVDVKMSNSPMPKKVKPSNEHNLTKWKLFKILVIKFSIALVFLFISLFIQGFFMIYSDSYYKTYTTPLHDRIHTFFEYPPRWISYNLSNNLIALLTLTFIQLILFNSIFLSIAIICRFLYMLGFFYILRGILVYVTSLPATLETCVPLERGNFAFNLLQVAKINMNLVYVCSDLIISGHSFSTTIFLLFSLFYMNNIILKTVIAFFCCFIYALIIIGFIHYTSDVLLGFIFAIFIFTFYHIMLDIFSQYYIFNKLFEIKIISNKKNVQAKPFFLRCFFTRMFLKIIPFIEGLNYTLDYAISKNADLSTFCICEKEFAIDVPEVCSFSKSGKKNKISISFSDHLFHSYAGDGTINFLLFNFLRKIKMD